MADIPVISTSIIRAPNPIGDSTQQIELTPWDLQYISVGSIQKGLLFRNPKAKDTDALIQHLKHSFSSTLHFFPPLAGHFNIVEHDDGTSSVFVVCNNAGALFVHAVAENTTVSDILEPIYVPHIVCSFFPLNGVKSYECTSKPLLGVQVTELKDGIFIGCTISHSVADGSSFWNFFNSWAEISRGSDKISRPPSLERWFLDGIDRPIRIPFTKEKQDSDGFISKPPPERFFHFTKEKIANLKTKANAEVRTNKISSLQALLTHIWRSVVRNQCLDPQEEVKYILVIGARSRLNPPLPDNYFGNAALLGTVTMKAGELLDGGLGNAAREMNKMISSHTEEKLKSDYECWLKSPKLLNLREFSGNKLGTSGSPRFDFYGNDFGWGKPVAVRSGPAHKNYGKLTVYAGAEEGSIDIELCLPYEVLEAMGRDPEFIEAVFI